MLPCEHAAGWHIPPVRHTALAARLDSVRTEQGRGCAVERRSTGLMTYIRACPPARRVNSRIKGKNSTFKESKKLQINLGRFGSAVRPLIFVS